MGARMQYQKIIYIVTISLEKDFDRPAYKKLMRKLKADILVLEQLLY